MLTYSEFENAVMAIFTKKTQRGVSESRILVKTCLAIYSQTIEKNREWVTRAGLSNAVYGEVENYTIDRIKKNIARIRKRLKEYLNSADSQNRLSDFRIIDNQKTSVVVRDNKNRLVVAYKLGFQFTQGKSNPTDQPDVSGFAGNYGDVKNETSSIPKDSERSRSIKGVILAETLAIKEKAQRYLDGKSSLEELRASTPMLTSIASELSYLKTEQIIEYRRAVTLDMEMKKAGNKEKLLTAIQVCDDLITSLKEE